MTLSFVKSAEIKRLKKEGREEGRRGGGERREAANRGEECTTKGGESEDMREGGVKERG